MVGDGSAEPALEAIALTKHYRRGAVALSDVSLRVASGSTTALVGPNAAGKSTLIKAWVGFERPTAGGVRVRGIDPWHDRVGALRHVAYVPQQSFLYRELSVSDHLRLASRARRGFDIAMATAHVDTLGIPRAARPSALSGGQQAQVMLAIALGTRADTLLLDEPLSSLDPLARSEFLGMLRSAVREGGATALLSSHIVTDIEQVCDRIIVLGVGRVLLDASLADAISAHRIGDIAAVAEPGTTEIGRFAADDGTPVVLLRLTDTGPPASAGAKGSLRAATIDEVVKGYLVAVRRMQRESAD
jgi:ABC-2 type transport system ATP-binding protein